MDLKASDKIIEFIAEQEGFRSRPYKDAVGVCTIGYGTTYYDICGRSVRCDDNPISKEVAMMLLTDKVNTWYAPKVSSMVNDDTSQNEFDALVSFAYNLGVNALKKSSLLRYHNAGDKLKASKEFGRWVHAGGKVLRGLVKRRHAEREIYLS